METNPVHKDDAFSYNKTVEKGWGIWPTFLASYGLKPTPEGYEQGKQILKTMMAAEQDAERSKSKRVSGTMERK